MLGFEIVVIDFETFNLNSMDFWKDVIGYEGLYACNSMGTVKSLERVKSFKKAGKEIVQNQRIMESLMKPYINKDGYACVKLARDGKYREGRVHRIVYCSFH